MRSKLPFLTLLTGGALIFSAPVFAQPAESEKGSEQVLVTKFYEAYKKRWNQPPFEESLNAYTTIRFMAKAMEKAGKADREALINAAEGLSIDHPVLGTITVRGFDHQSTAGWWFGYLNWDPTNNRAGMRDAKLVKSENYLPTKEEIDKLRSK